jgi:hypothetical protein
MFALKAQPTPEQQIRALMREQHDPALYTVYTMIREMLEHGARILTNAALMAACGYRSMKPLKKRIDLLVERGLLHREKLPLGDKNTPIKYSIPGTEFTPREQNSPHFRLLRRENIPTLRSDNVPPIMNDNDHDDDIDHDPSSEKSPEQKTEPATVTELRAIGINDENWLSAAQWNIFQVRAAIEKSRGASNPPAYCRRVLDNTPPVPFEEDSHADLSHNPTSQPAPQNPPDTVDSPPEPEHPTPANDNQDSKESTPMLRDYTPPTPSRQITPQHVDAWRMICVQLRSRYGINYETMFGAQPVLVDVIEESDGEAWLIAIENPYTVRVLNTRHNRHIRTIASNYLMHPVNVQFISADEWSAQS